MATVTITEILGGDNIAASRIILNNNFTLLQNSINTLETRLNTSYVPGGSLNVGDVQVLRYNRAASVNLFLCQGSAQIDGNLNLGTPTNSSTLGLTGAATISSTLTVDGAVTFNNTANTDTFINDLQYIGNDSETNEQWSAANSKSLAVNVQVAVGVLPIIDTVRVMHLDVSTATTANVLTLPAVGTVNAGQIVSLVFDTNAPSNLTFELDNATNFDPAFDNTAIGSNIILNTTLNSQTDAKFTGIWIDLVAGANGWKVIGAHGDVTYY